MKALCLAALLANLVFFAWSHWLVPAPATTPADSADAVPRLVLVSEAQSTGGMEGARVGAAQTAAGSDAGADRGPQPATMPRCSSVGPFADLPDATQAATILRARGFQPRTRAIEDDVSAGLWVHIDDIANRADAQRALAVLKASGITDPTLMEPAGSSLTLSLGIFTDPARAQRRAADVRALGFTPKITERTRRGTVYWLDNDLKPSDVGLNPALIQSGAGGRIARMEVRPCPDAKASGSE